MDVYIFQQNCAGYTREIKSLEMTDDVLCRRRQRNQTFTPSRVLPWNPGARLEAVASHGVFKIYHGLSIKQNCARVMHTCHRTLSNSISILVGDMILSEILKA